jgi:hypothetical protein
MLDVEPLSPSARAEEVKTEQRLTRMRVGYFLLGIVFGIAISISAAIFLL